MLHASGLRQSTAFGPLHSGPRGLQVGFYDSVDKAPQWFYMSQGVWVLGSLELQTWTVARGAAPRKWRREGTGLQLLYTVGGTSKFI